MKKCLVMSMMGVMLLGIFIGGFVQGSDVHGEETHFQALIPVATANGFGFYDKRDGKMYFYNSDLSVCERILQLDKLGEKWTMIQDLPGLEKLGKHPSQY